jgi:hypothetical protein
VNKTRTYFKPLPIGFYLRSTPDTPPHDRSDLRFKPDKARQPPSCFEMARGLVRSAPNPL